MRYRDTVDQSTGYLGPALSLMAKQTAAWHPVSYAVWYEYVAGNNASLKDSIDGYLQNGVVLDEALTDDLFNRYIADCDLQAARKFSDGFQRVMEEMASSAILAGDEAGQYENALAKWCADWTVSNPGSDHQAETILVITRKIQRSIAFMKTRLEESRHEIESLHQEVGRAREDAHADGLTGLANRRGFDIAITACWSAVNPDRCGPGLIMADIDHFKQVNDTYGHPFGDRVIRGIAQILKGSVKGKGTAARYGGEEFVVLLPDTSIEDTCQLAETIRVLVEKCRIKRSSDDWAPADISVSLGVAGFRSGESAADCIARADVALYASKNNGRNRVTVASP